MAYDFSEFKKQTQKISEWLKGELVGVRTGRATPALLDSVVVDMYGSRLPLNQAGSIAVEDARTLRVSPWDASQIKAIEKAIVTADLGVSAAADETGVRVIFPELTAERRQTLLKLIGTRLEEARVSIRQERDEIWNDIQKREKEGKLTEDEKFRCKDELQKLVDQANKQLEEIAERKEKEISQ